MSAADLSPLEQLAQSQPASDNSSSDISPLEQLAQQPTPTTTPVNSGATAQEMAKAGVSEYKPGSGIPYGHAGAGFTSSDLTPTQAKAGALTTAGAAGAAGAGEALPSVFTHTIEGAKALGSWAARNPIQAWVTLEILKEAIPGVKKATQLIHAAPGE